MNRRNNLRLLLIFILIGFVISPAFADEQEINLNPEQTYVDVPVVTEEQTTIHIETISGTPQTNPSFIDSWVYLLDSTYNVLFADDDSNHSASNVLASKINRVIEAGQYYIRATSYAFVCCNNPVTGSYLLTWNGVTTITPTPTPSIEPTPSLEPTISPSPTLEPELPTPTPTIEPTLQPEINQNTDNSESEPILISETPTPLPNITPQEIVTIEQEIEEQIVVEETLETPIEEVPLSIEELQEQINAEYIEENTIQLELPTALVDIPGAELIFASAEAVLNVGSDMTEEEREEAQSVVVSAIVLTQIAQMASVGISNRRLK
jgi:hypothetical protein